MAKSGTKNGRPATINANVFAMIAKGVLCPLPLVPAILINLDQSAGKGVAWTAFAIGSVLACALAVELVREVKSISSKLIWCGVASVFLVLNIANAIGNSATHSGDVRDDKSSQQRIVANIVARSSQLSHRRQAQVAIAGEDSSASIRAGIESAIAKDAGRWHSTGGCAAEKITARLSKKFCSQIGELKVRLAAAVERENIDAQLTKLNERKVGPAPSSTDPQADSLMSFLAALGYRVKDRSLISSAIDWGKGIGAEVLAAFLPAGIAMMLSGTGRSEVPVPQEPKVKGRSRREDGSQERIKEDYVPADPDISAFHAERLEVVQGQYLAPRALFDAWCEHCSEKGVEPGSIKGFSLRIQKLVGREHNGGRPRYCHVRIRERGKAKLRVVG